MDPPPACVRRTLPNMHLLLQRKLRRIITRLKGRVGSGACAPFERVDLCGIVGLTAMAAAAIKLLLAEVLDVSWLVSAPDDSCFARPLGPLPPDY